MTSPVNQSNKQLHPNEVIGVFRTTTVSTAVLDALSCSLQSRTAKILADAPMTEAVLAANSSVTEAVTSVTPTPVPVSGRLSAVSDNGFEWIPSVPKLAETTLTQLADQNSSDAGFELIRQDDIVLPKAPLFENDEAMIDFVNQLTIDISGNADARSAFYLLSQDENESDVAFARRKLSALSTPLLQNNVETLTPAQKDVFDKINAWHASTCDSAYRATGEEDPLVLKKNKMLAETDTALAGTAYYYTQGRLLIRHASINATTAENEKNAMEIIRRVTQTITLSLMLSEGGAIQIEHVIPRIQKGILHVFNGAEHIVSEFITEKMTVNSAAEISVYPAFYDLTLSSRFVGKKIIDPQQAIFDLYKYIYPYESLGVQPIENDVDCGRYVTLISVIAMLILTNQRKNACELSANDFVPYKEYLLGADSGRSPRQLKSLFEDLRYQGPVNVGSPNQGNGENNRVFRPSAVATCVNFFAERIVPRIPSVLSVDGTSTSPGTPSN